MSFSPRTRLVNPRLGTYFSIFASAFAGLFLLLLILEQLGASSAVLRAVMLAGPLVIYAAIGLGSATREPLEFFASGRRVPAVYNGLALAMTAMGATGLVGLTGAFFLIGFDALAIVIGGLAGFVVMAVLLAPFLRKFGAYTVPTYLGRRFDSLTLRIVAAALLAVPMLLMLAAEMRIGAFAASTLAGVPAPWMTILIGVAIVTTVAPGGMRALSWSGAAKLIAGLMALMAPVATVAVLVTNLPVPQLTTGPLLRSLVRREAAEGLVTAQPAPFVFELPSDGFAALAKPFASAFGSVGSGAFVIAIFSILAGVAAAPWLLPRIATAPGVYEARKSLGWATLCFGIVMLTLAAIGIFMRDFVMDYVQAGGPLPVWFGQLEALGYAAADPSAPSSGASSLAFLRDGVLFSLPVAAGMPVVALYLAIAGVLAVALAGAASAALALGNLVAEDILSGLSWEPAPPDARVWAARAALLGAAAFGGLLASIAPTDPLKLMLWALALTGSSAFPVLVLSIWWKGLNGFGALAGMASGFAVAVITILAGEAGWISLNGALAGAVGIPAGGLAAVIVSLATPAPSRRALELLGDIRVAGGEILYDREMRLARLKQGVKS